MPEYTATADDSGQRLDHFLSGKHPELSRARLQALIKDQLVLLNGRPSKPSVRIKCDEVISLELPEAPAEPVAAAPEELPLEILFEDADLIVLNKAAGMVVHPAAGNPSGTLVNALLHHCGDALSSVGGEDRQGIVHRLDKETSGCIIAAKNDEAHAALSAQFAGRSVDKIYLALTKGIFRQQFGTVETMIGRHPVHRKKMAVLTKGDGRPAKTGYRVLRERPGKITLVECMLFTGRTHQIRVHMKHLGHPLLGDELYGQRGGYPRQMLHAWKVAFTHPRTGEALSFLAPLPEDFLAAGGDPEQE